MSTKYTLKHYNLSSPPTTETVMEYNYIVMAWLNLSVLKSISIFDAWMSISVPDEIFQHTDHVLWDIFQ